MKENEGIGFPDHSEFVILGFLLCLQPVAI